MRLGVTLIAALAFSGCLTPRSLVLGQTAAPVGREATEVGVFTGIGYASQTDPPIRTNSVGATELTNQTTVRGFALPGAEANAQLGFSDHYSLNVHASSAGLQPGLKWTINESRILHVALLPSVAFGYASVAHSVLQAGSDGQQNEIAIGSTTSLSFLAGLKVLFSHRSGFYAGAGYEFVFNRSLASSQSLTGSGNTKASVLTTTGQQQLTAALGYDIALGAVHLRPEVAFAAIPYIGTTWVSSTPGKDDTSVSSGGGYGFVILPGFSIAVASPARAADETEEDERPTKKDGDDEASSDDEEDKPKPGRSRRKAPGKAVDDEEEKPKRKSRSESDEAD